MISNDISRKHNVVRQCRMKQHETQCVSMISDEIERKHNIFQRFSDEIA